MAKLRKAANITSSFSKTGKDAAEAFEPPEEPLHFVALAIKSLVVQSGFPPVLLGRNHGNIATFLSTLPRFVVLVGAVHEQRQAGRQRADKAQQEAAFHRVRRLARRQRPRYGCAIIRGNQMNFGAPSAAGAADRLGGVFCKAPVPSGRNLTTVESSFTASIRTRRMRSRCKHAKTWSSTPFFAQRFRRT